MTPLPVSPPAEGGEKPEPVDLPSLQGGHKRRGAPDADILSVIFVKTAAFLR